MPLARSCAGHSLPAPHSSLHGQGRREWLHAQSGEPERPWTVFWTPSPAWACHRLFGYPLGWGVYLERVGWRPGAQKREGLPLVPFSLVPDRVTTANGPGGAQVHDLAENHGGRHPATELCRRGIGNEHNRRHTRKGKVLHVPEHATQCRVLPQSPQPRARARSWFHLS